MLPKTKNNIARMATGLMALLFLGTGGVMLIGNPAIVQQFKAWGYPSWMRTVIGALQIAGAIGLFIPKLRSLAIYGLIGIMVGAIYTHSIKEGMPIASFGAIIVILLGIVILKLREAED